MKIGAAWIRKSKDGEKTFLSCVIGLPIIGKLNFTLFKNEKKEQDNQPDYEIVWNAEKKDGGADNFSGGNIPF